MTEFLVILGILWVIRAVYLVIRMALYRSDVSASYNGFRVHIPLEAQHALSPREVEAVLAHELGHKHHQHPWKNYLLRLFFIRVSPQRRLRQEKQADDFAAARGHALTMSAALRKRGGCREDFDRADRLEEIGIRELKNA